MASMEEVFFKDMDDAVRVCVCEYQLKEEEGKKLERGMCEGARERKSDVEEN